MCISGKLPPLLRLLAANAGRGLSFIPRVAAFFEAATRGYFYWIRHADPLVYAFIFNYLQNIVFKDFQALRKLRNPWQHLLHGIEVNRS